MATNTPSLNVIGLISGGKDSVYSLLHCLVNNHRVVALANLHPPPASCHSDEAEDLNSYMYQTAGHGIIPLYAEALGLPLYRQEISGAAANSSKDYSFRGNSQGIDDETESLLPLLRKAMAAHPTANAVCSGAILSTYQRTRIESVARRLNLIPLSYLWQYPSLPPPSQGGLLDDMAAIGFDVRIVKVASGGLDENLLWSNLMEPAERRKVERSVARFGGSVLGEGGEYETLVVDGPGGVWKRRIEVQSHERFIGRGGGGEAWIGFRDGAGKVEMKLGEEPRSNEEWKGPIRTIQVWDKEIETLIAKPIGLPEQNVTERKVEQPSSVQTVWEPRTVIVKNGSTLTLSNITDLGNGTTAAEQMLRIKSKLLKILAEYNPCDTDDIVFTTILLRSMADFAAVNDVYGRLFTKPNPAARVTVACGDALPEGVRLMVSCVIDLGPRSARDGLHVQSRSYWAPANIGPYSQAISVPQSQEKEYSLVYVAGQIPLVPASMEVFQAEKELGEEIIGSSNEQMLFVKRMYLALQHLWRIGKVMNVGWWTGAVAFITGPGDVQIKARLAWEAWRGVHERELWENDDEEEDGLDVWDRRYGGMGSLAKETAGIQPLPDFSRISDSASSNVPGFLAVELDELPRGCDIEWQSLGVAYQNSATPCIESLVSYIGLQSDQELRARLLDMVSEVKFYEKIQATVYTPNASLVSDLDVQIIPCRGVWGADGMQLAGGVTLHYEGV
ncbi:hypothetical protein OEA41_000434 [Lepraria neglecta]|uniref:Diphthine--ammonia ligase n=1 Tax=Lepraria neglecta TaxID=209136 RepID=A0AAE0DPG1_9LECA|nr:hypothetical protein OEA41_000434 [Lepraria neglecta]